MSEKQYLVCLNGIIIGRTALEKADPPMGVVYGVIDFIDDVESRYEFLLDYCKCFDVEPYVHYPEVRMIGICSGS